MVDNKVDLRIQKKLLVRAILIKSHPRRRYLSTDVSILMFEILSFLIIVLFALFSPFFEY